MGTLPGSHQRRHANTEVELSNERGMPIEEILEHYRGLWQVERRFYIAKNDLKVRPIYHWTPKRIRAHLAIAYMAFACVRHLAYRVKLQKPGGVGHG